MWICYKTLLCTEFLGKCNTLQCAALNLTLSLTLVENVKCFHWRWPNLVILVHIPLLFEFEIVKFSILHRHNLRDRWRHIYRFIKELCPLPPSPPPTHTIIVHQTHVRLVNNSNNICVIGHLHVNRTNVLLCPRQLHELTNNY